MKLGTYAEIRTAVGDVAAALAFYEQLGFARAGEQAGEVIVCDGGVNIRLARETGEPPALSYMGSDPSAVRAALGGAAPDGGAFTAPGGLRVTLDAQPGAVAMPDGPPISRVGKSRLGKFGELAVPVPDTRAAIAFWQRLGFEQLHLAEEPYPWAILTDGLIVLGLHQTADFSEPKATYFAADMGDRIAALAAEGVAITPVPPEVDGRVVNAAFSGPGGLGFFIFAGEI